MKHNYSGFTLLELMIVVAVIGILASIAYPSYSNYVTKSRRSDAKSAVLKVQLAEEKWRANNVSYTNSFTQLGVPSTSPDGYYQVAITAVSGTTYTITATPAVGGLQVGDSDCASMAINQSGTRTSSSSSDCW